MQSFANRGKCKKPPWKIPLLAFIVLVISILLLFLLIFYKQTSPSISASSRTSPLPQFPRCRALTLGERFLWYAPHSGFSNQVSEFKNAILMAAILNRTLIVPPILDHHAVALGSCPKFRVLNPNELRIRVWDHAIELFRAGRYVSLANILDISSLSSMIDTIDFRDFVSLWCGMDLNLACSMDTDARSSPFNSLRRCGFLLSRLNGNVEDCVYPVDEDCRTTVWTYQQNQEDGSLDSFQPDEQLRTKKKISFVRRRRDVYRKLGPGSDAHSATLVAFGSLFTSPYRGSELLIDIHESRGDRRMQSLIEKIEFVSFVPAITNAGRKYSSRIIKSPFLCAQLRLLDGQFKNHWKATFSQLRQKVESLKQALIPRPIHIFVMTDLPVGNWSGTYLGDLAGDAGSFKLHVMREADDYVTSIAREVASLGLNTRSTTAARGTSYDQKYDCSKGYLPDILLYLEETVCACASLGFVGTPGSTIAESIELMRKNSVCSG
ncbi:hypothetical protein Dimus_026433 [Dionaea muscipula]